MFFVDIRNSGKMVKFQNIRGGRKELADIISARKHKGIRKENLFLNV